MFFVISFCWSFHREPRKKEKVKAGKSGQLYLWMLKRRSTISYEEKVFLLQIEKKKGFMNNCAEWSLYTISVSFKQKEHKPHEIFSSWKDKRIFLRFWGSSNGNKSYPRKLRYRHETWKCAKSVCVWLKMQLTTLVMSWIYFLSVFFLTTDEKEAKKQNCYFFSLYLQKTLRFRLDYISLFLPPCIMETYSEQRANLVIITERLDCARHIFLLSLKYQSQNKN